MQIAFLLIDCRGNGNGVYWQQAPQILKRLDIDNFGGKFGAVSLISSSSLHPNLPDDLLHKEQDNLEPKRRMHNVETLDIFLMSFHVILR